MENCRAGWRRRRGKSEYIYKGNDFYFMQFNEMEDISIIQKRLKILFSQTIENRYKIKDAIKIQDKLRKKSGKWNATEFIRKWRDERCMY